MEKIKLFIVGLLLASGVYAQEESVIGKGLIKTYATLSPGIRLEQSYPDMPYYLHGNLEFYIDKNISIVGETYLDMEAISKEKYDPRRMVIWIQNSPIQFYLSTFFGANYHWTGKRGDFYIGLQPGFGIIELEPYYYRNLDVHPSICPLASLSTGYNYFVSRYFNFFIQGRFLTGRHLYGRELPLTELRFSGGLGFNLNTMRQKN